MAYEMHYDYTLSGNILVPRGRRMGPSLSARNVDEAIKIVEAMCFDGVFGFDPRNVTSVKVTLVNDLIEMRQRKFTRNG